MLQKRIICSKFSYLKSFFDNGLLLLILYDLETEYNYSEGNSKFGEVTKLRIECHEMSN